MKLSEFSTDEGFDVLCAITPYVCNVTADEELLNAAKSKIAPHTTGISKAQLVLLGAKKITELLPLALKKHRNDLYNILAALHETTVEEIAKQPLSKTIIMVKEMSEDRELLSFFDSPAKEGGGE